MASSFGPRPALDGPANCLEQGTAGTLFLASFNSSCRVTNRHPTSHSPPTSSSATQARRIHPDKPVICCHERCSRSRSVDDAASVAAANELI
jgi:hypothetical protein